MMGVSFVDIVEEIVRPAIEDRQPATPNWISGIDLIRAMAIGSYPIHAECDGIDEHTRGEARAAFYRCHTCPSYILAENNPPIEERLC